MKDITIREYYNLNNKIEYNVVLSSLKEQKTFLNKSISLASLSYLDVKQIFKLIPKLKDNELLISEIYCLAYQIDDDTFWNASITELFANSDYTLTFFKETFEREAKLLTQVETKYSHIWKQAGGERMNKFSDLMPLIVIGKLFSIYPYDLQTKPYEEILLLLYVNKEQGEIEQEFNRLISKQK